MARYLALSGLAFLFGYIMPLWLVLAVVSIMTLVGGWLLWENHRWQKQFGRVA